MNNIRYCQRKTSKLALTEHEHHELETDFGLSCREGHVLAVLSQNEWRMLVAVRKVAAKGLGAE